jgi:hypothetical protein
MEKRLYGGVKMKSPFNSSVITGRSSLVKRIGKKMEENISKVHRAVAILGFILIFIILFALAIVSHSSSDRGLTWLDVDYLTHHYEQKIERQIGIKMSFN